MGNTMKGAALDAAKKELVGMTFNGYEVSDIKPISVEKIGGTHEGIEVSYKDSPVGNVFYGISSVEELKDAIKSSLNEGIESVRALITPHNTALYRLRAINFEANEDFLKDKPYKQVYDLAIIGFFDFGKGTGVLNNVTLKGLDITFDEFYEAALENIRGEVKIVPMLELLSGLIGEDEDLQSEDMGDCPLFVVGDGCHPESTALLGDQKWLEDIHCKLGDFYIIPSSVNELLISPAAILPAEEILPMVGMINSGCVAPEEVLSNNIYKFDGTLSIISALDTATA